MMKKISRRSFFAGLRHYGSHGGVDCLRRR